MTTTMTLADLAATSLSAVRILEQHGLDYCCGGKQPFEEACHTKGLKPESIMREIDQSNVATVAGRDWLAAPLDELAKHIVTTHHEYLKLDLPVLGHRMEKVASVHGARDPKVLPRMAEVFAALRAEMEVHMRKEETILFPFIAQYGRAEVQGRPMPPVPFGSIANPIAIWNENMGAQVMLSAKSAD